MVEPEILHRYKIDAELKSSTGILISYLNCMPNIKVKSEGTSIIADIKFEASLEKEAIEAQFHKKYIIFEFRSKSETMNSHVEHLLVIFSILAYLKDLYAASFECLYSFVVQDLLVRESRLLKEEPSQSLKTEKLLHEMACSNRALSEELMRKQQVIDDLTLNLRKSANMISPILDYAGLIHNSDMPAQLDKYGITKSELSWLLGFLNIK